MDIFVASDSTPSLLLRNKHNRTFAEEGVERGVAFSADGVEQAGMGVAVGTPTWTESSIYSRRTFPTTRARFTGMMVMRVLPT